MRLKSERPKKAISVRLDLDTFIEVKTLLLDPMRGRTKYGEMGSLINHLLKGWILEQRAAYLKGNTTEDTSNGRVDATEGLEIAGT